MQFASILPYLKLEDAISIKIRRCKSRK